MLARMNQYIHYDQHTHVQLYPGQEFNWACVVQHNLI
jgi:hypothetical protein